MSNCVIKILSVDVHNSNINGDSVGRARVLLVKDWHLGWGLLNRFRPFPYIPSFAASSKYFLYNIRFMFDSCRNSSAARIPVKD